MSEASIDSFEPFKLNEKAKTNEAQPDAGHDLVSAIEPLRGLVCPDSLIKIRLRRSPDEGDQNQREANAESFLIDTE